MEVRAGCGEISLKSDWMGGRDRGATGAGLDSICMMQRLPRNGTRTKQHAGMQGSHRHRCKLPQHAACSSHESPTDFAPSRAFTRKAAAAGLRTLGRSRLFKAGWFYRAHFPQDFTPAVFSCLSFPITAAGQFRISSLARKAPDSLLSRTNL